MFTKKSTGKHAAGRVLILDDIDANIVNDRAVNGWGQEPWVYPTFKLHGTRYKVHREIAKRMGLIPLSAKGYHKGQHVDHINGNIWDCRRENLRLADYHQNAHNRTKPRKGSKSGLKGVSWEGGKWVVYIVCKGKRERLGLFTDRFAAAKVYDARALELFGEFATTNAMLGLYPEQTQEQV